ncbi:MAG TPA: GNAT family N-acetyltransferase [Bryobacteraceae bacterium]|nr:GNAT family N-acetyltransferase [Bryobacteraceae bacterium]
MNELKMRRMTLEDVGRGLELCRAAKWNQVERDWRFFVEQSRAGCLAEESDGRVVGTSATLDYGQEFAWIAMVLVDPECRGQGIGTRLLEASIKLLDGRKSIRLDATPAGERVYRPLGFKEEFPLARYERPAGEFRAEVCRAVVATDWQWILGMDREAFGSERETLLRWLAEGAPDLAMTTGDGYCFGRHGFRFDHIGPIVARTPESAERLLRAAMAKCGREVVVDAPIEHELVLTGLGFVKQRPFLRMSLGQAPVFDAGLNFAITGPEFA